MGTPSGDNDAGPHDGIPGGRRVGPWRKRIMIAVSALAVVFIAVPVFFTATPGQCASCHEMQPYYDSWRTSAHRAAAPNCLYCHVRPGVLNLALYELTFYREIFGHIAGSEVTAGGPNAPSAESCQRDACHSLNREASYAGDIKINHRGHVVDAEIGCSECHPGVVHEGVGDLAMLPPTSLCRECHADDMENCSYCHGDAVSKPAPDSH